MSLGVAFSGNTLEILKAFNSVLRLPEHGLVSSFPSKPAHSRSPVLNALTTTFETTSSIIASVGVRKVSGYPVDRLVSVGEKLVLDDVAVSVC